MNGMGKRYLQKILQRPLTSVEEIQKRYDKINAMNLDKKIYSHLCDMCWYYLRWKRMTLPLKNLYNMIIMYQKLSTIYPIIIPVLDMIENCWDLEKMESDLDFLKNTSDEYKEWNRKYESLMDLFKKEETPELTFYITDSVADSYYQITNARWKKWSKKDQERFRIISSQTSSCKIMVKDYEKHLFQMMSLQSKIKKYQKEQFEKESNQIFENYASVLEKFHDMVSEDSALSVLKHFFQAEGYTCPIVEKREDFFLEVVNIRHLIIEHLNKNEVFVPFSVEITPKNMGKLIYGMNSSGKSTFMKSIVLALWFAQCGLWVSAESFRFTPMEKIFTKFSHSDNLFKQQSLYVAEISELKYIIERSNKKTFLCLDELTSGTEIHSSSSLILSLFEFFYEKKIPFLFTTHIHFISNYIQNNFKDKICLYHFTLNESRLQKDNVIYTLNINDLYDRELKKGPGPSIYGIEVAEKLGIPKEIIDRSYELRKHIRIDYQEKGNKKSKYNSSLKVEECFRCGSRENLHTHHIFPQKCFDKKEVLENGFRKNGLYNLLILCMTCH